MEGKRFQQDMKDKCRKKWFQQICGPYKIIMDSGLIISADMYHRTNMHLDYLTLYCIYLHIMPSYFILLFVLNVIIYAKYNLMADFILVNYLD